MLEYLDWILIATYFVIVFLVAFWSSFSKKRKSKSSSDYFLAGRNIGWFIIGASLFASNIGSEHLVGLAGTGAASGVAVGQFEILASFMLLILGWLFVPFYLKSGVFTMPEFLEKRYSSGARWYLAVISIVGYVLTKISVTIAAGGIVFESLMGIEFWTGALIVVIITGIYTVLGGLRAVLYTDMIQMFILVGGAIAVTIVGLIQLGGLDELYNQAGSGFFSLWKPMSDPNFPWTGILFGAPILGVWYWCTDQFIVQRVLSGKDINHSRRGTIFAGYLKLLPLFIFVIPGIIAYALTQTGDITLDSPDHALPTLIGTLLPVGLKGIVVAGLLAALMSSLSSVFNSCSTLITWDIYKKLKPETTEKSLVLVGRIATVILVVLGLLWIPMMKLISGQIYQYLQSVQAYISPPIAAIFLIGVLSKRVNSQGAIAALISGFILGIARLVLELMKDSVSGVLYQYADLNFLHFAFLLFLVCTLVLVVVSYFTSKPANQKIDGLTIHTTGKETDDRGKDWKKRDLILSILLIACIGLVWIYFSG
ncbi:MAG: sodium/solute symporter [Ignavibacteriaceae bacterium]|nr:sodium/solute symporter [Ignavibacteriaceae bacterium]